MILNFVDNDFNLSNKTELKDNDGKVTFTGIYDFSFKGRIRIFDVNNNDVGYVQFKILSDSDQIGFFDKGDKQVAYIKQTADINNIILLDDGWSFNGNLEALDFEVIDKNNKQIMKVTNNSISIDDDNDAIKCVMCMYVIANLSELTK